MTIGTANKTKLSFIKEVTPGITPTTPAMQLLRFKSETLQYNNSTTQSEEITEGRDITDLILTDQSNAGEVTCELSATTFDEIMEAALMSDTAWSSDSLVATTIAAVASGFTDGGGAFISSGFEVGQFVNISGFSNSAIDGYYRILTVVANTITTFPAPPATEGVSQSITVAGSSIKTGSADHSYTIQKSIIDVAAPTYINYRGCRVSTMNMSLTIGSIVDFVFGVTGMTSEVTESQISGLTEVAKTSTDIMNAVGDVSNIVANGTNVTTALKFTDLSLSYDNSLRELKAIGTLGAIDVRAGTINCSASLNPYFEDKELLDAFLANASFTLSWQLTSTDGYSYIFSLPNVKFTSQSLGAGARDTDMIINSEVQAILDNASSSTMRIDRFTP